MCDRKSRKSRGIRINQSSSIRIIVVDDHQVLREGIHYVCLTAEDIDLVGEAANGRDALKLCDELQPDVALVDLMMPDMDGIATIKVIRQQYPEIKILVLTSFNSESLINQALKEGAHGYILKSASTKDIINSIRLTYQGMSIISFDVSNIISSKPSYFPLTPRQLEVLKLMAKGLSNIQIGKEMSISPYTARFHVSEILSKLNVSKRCEAIVVAMKQNLIE